jgi:DNA-binding MarR family transcriptional regulator
MVRIKRAHLRALAAARPFSRRVGLTPARYDFMHAMVAFTVEPPQHLLWRVLGISRTSASKMVRRLIELGLVTRRRAPRDRRTFLLSLTAEGERRWRRAFLGLRKQWPLQRRFERAFGERSWNTFRAVDTLTSKLIRLARHLGDTAWTLYPTRPIRIGPLRLSPRPTGIARGGPALSRTRPAPAALRRTG